MAVLVEPIYSDPFKAALRFLSTLGHSQYILYAKKSSDECIFEWIFHPSSDMTKRENWQICVKRNAISLVKGSKLSQISSTAISSEQRISRQKEEYTTLLFPIGRRYSEAT